MRRKYYLLAVVLLTASFGRSGQANMRADDDPNLIGWIKPISRLTYLIKNGDPDTKFLTLRPGTDAGQPLHGGDKVRCDQGGRMLLNIYGSETPVNGSNEWKNIPFLPPPNDAVRAALLEYGHLGGRRRPGTQVLLSPSKESKVSIDRLTFRWVPRQGLVMLIISTETGQVLWEQARIQGMNGRLVSDTAKQRLAAFRQRGGNGVLILTLAGGGGDQPTVRFQLLTEEEERRLQQELSAMDQQTKGILKHVGRAGIFNRYEMYTEMAQEYEKALEKEPRSVHLIRKTAEVYRMIGDSKRLVELQNLLPPGIELD